MVVTGPFFFVIAVNDFRFLSKLRVNLKKDIKDHRLSDFFDGPCPDVREIVKRSGSLIIVEGGEE